MAGFEQWPPIARESCNLFSVVGIRRSVNGKRRGYVVRYGGFDLLGATRLKDRVRGEEEAFCFASRYYVDTSNAPRGTGPPHD